MSIFSTILKKERERKRMSQAELACGVGVTKQMISLWETGKAVPSVTNADKAFKVLGVSVTIGAYHGNLIDGREV